MRLVIEVPDELHTRFKEKTASVGVTQAETVRILLSEYVSESEPARKAAFTPVNAAERPTNAAEAQRRRDELLRKARKGK